MPPDEPVDEDKIEQEAEDYDTPFSLPDDDVAETADGDGADYSHARLDTTHPATDTNIQLEELYDEGVSGAAEASEPNVGDRVIGFDKSKKAQKEDDQKAA